MITKMIGALLVLASTSFYGYYIGEYLKKRIESLEQFKRGFILYEKDSAYTREALDIVLLEISKRLNLTAKEVFYNTADTLKNHKYECVNRAWEESLNRTLNKSFLDKEDIDNLKIFGKSLGFSSQGLQEANVYLTVEYIDRKVLELNKKYIDEAGLYKRIGVMTGILLVITII